MTFEEKEKNYERLVSEAAKKINMIFVIDSSEGRDMETDMVYMEDLSGWLIPPDKLQQLKESRKSGETELFDSSYCFAEWSIEQHGDIKINFKQY